MSAVASAWAKAVIKNNPELGPSERRMLKALARLHSVEKGYASPSYRDMTRETEDSLSTTHRAADKLTALGLVNKEAQRKGQRQAPNRYYLNMGILRVSSRRSQDSFSGCQNLYPEAVSPRHPEEFSQSVTMTPPYAHARALFGRNRGFQGSTLKVGGRHG